MYKSNKTVIAVNPEKGLMKLEGKTVILTMGCRERTRGAIRIRANVLQVYLLQVLLNVW